MNTLASISLAHQIAASHRKVTRDDVLEYISTAKPSDLLQILDELVEPVANYLGCATGIEDDKVRVLRQIENDESGA